MSNSKKKLILNSDYYSANTYALEEKTKTISIQILLKLILTVIIFVVTILIYIEVKRIVLIEYPDTEALVNVELLEMNTTAEPVKVIQKQVQNVKQETKVLIPKRLLNLIETINAELI